MHILYFHRTAGDRVEGVHIMGMVRAFRKLGHTVDICSPPGCDPEGALSSNDAPNPEKRGGVGFRAVLKKTARKAPPVLFEIAELIYNLYSFVELTKHISGKRPDLLYERTTANSISPSLLASALGVPLIQEVNVTTETGRFRKLVLKSISSSIEKYVASKATMAVTVSQAFRHILIADGWDKERTFVCPNAIEPGRFDPSDFDEIPLCKSDGAKGLIAGYVGSFLPYHRLEQIVKIARAFRQTDPHLHWLLVGDGVEMPRIRDLIVENGLEDRFWLPGRVPHEDVPRYIKTMDIAVLANSASFNSPMKLFEYMAMGKAVIAPRVPAIEEVVEHGHTGLLFEKGNTASLRKAIESLVEDDDLRKKLGRNAREYVLKNHTWEQNARRILDALEQIEKHGKVTTA